MHMHRSMCFLEAATFILLAGCFQHISAHHKTVAPQGLTLHNNTQYAACRIAPNSRLAKGLPLVSGHVLFKQEYPNGKLNVLIVLKGLPKKDQPKPKPVHIHQYGDLSLGCESTGNHYDPEGVDHPNHPGDFGNFWPVQGQIAALIEGKATLFDDMSVIGRSVVVHEDEDDLGLGGNEISLQTGNAGRRLCCCVIGISSHTVWDLHYEQFTS